MSKTKNGFKMPTSYTILFLLIVVVAILTWIVPGGEYNFECSTSDALIVEGEKASYCVTESTQQLMTVNELINSGEKLYYAATYDIQPDVTLTNIEIESVNSTISESNFKELYGAKVVDAMSPTSTQYASFVFVDNFEMVTLDPIITSDVIFQVANGEVNFYTEDGVLNEEVLSKYSLGTAEYVYAEFDDTNKNPQGFWQIVGAPIAGFYNAVDIALFVLVIGGFIEIVISTQAFDAGVSKLLNKFKGKEVYLIPVLMILFGIGGTTFGMAEETIAFYPLLIPVLIAAGFDVVTAVMIILLGAGVGVLGSTVNPFAIGVASGATGVSVGEGIVGRTILFLLVEGAAIAYTMRYAMKVKHDKSKSVTADINAEIEAELEEVKQVEFTKKHGVVLVLFGLSFFIMILGVIPWAYKFNIMFFENINNWFADHLSFVGFYNSASDFYFSTDTSASALGDWWFGQMTVLFFVMAVIIGFVSGMDNHAITNTFVKGSKALLGVALIIGMSRGIKIVMEAGGMDATVLYYGSGVLKKLGEIPYIIGTYIFYIPMSFLIPSTSGLAGASMPIMGPLGSAVYGGTAGIINTITAYASASGVVNLVTPTSGVVMGGLAIAKVPYQKWLKHIFPFLGILSAIIIIFLVLVSITGFTL